MNNLLKLLASVLVLPAFLLGCPTGGGGTDGGGGGGGDGGEDVLEPIIQVSGTAEIHPAALVWAADAGVTPPSLVGITARVEEPLKLALNENDASAIFSSTVLAADRAYTAPEVATEIIVVGIGVGFVDSTDAGIYRAASTIYDITRQGQKPRTNLTGTIAYAMPRGFVDQLTAAIGSTNISAASDNGGSTVASAGFALMRIVDATGKPVAGAKITFRCPTCAKNQNPNQYWYPNEALSSATSHAAGGTTSGNGLIVYIGKETLAHQIFVKVDGNAAYPEHAAGAKVGVGLSVTISPN